MKQIIRSWGRLQSEQHDVRDLTEITQVKQQLALTTLGLPFGMGRSYGDVCLNPEGILWRTTGLDHCLAFDINNGVLRCEAGLLLQAIQQLIVPHGWILPVTPGTQFVTVGGAVANDVHGKNHHRSGSFCDHVTWLKLVRTTGEVIECGPQLNAPWFYATAGGIGLTGLIVELEIRLKPILSPWLFSKIVPFRQLDEFWPLADWAEKEWEYTVAWLDCNSVKKAGRGLFIQANSIACDKILVKSRPWFSVNWTPPVSVANRLTLPFLNQGYYQSKRWLASAGIVHYEKFFYPLDHILGWNRLYGPKGFYQYQCVIDRAVGPQALGEMLKQIKKSKQGSFLTVLKTFGQRRSQGLLSFPRPGVTLAIDFANRGQQTVKLFNNLDAIVKQAYGSIYLAKDARMPRELFEISYPRLNEFLTYRDPGISSSLSRRLIGN